MSPAKPDKDWLDPPDRWKKWRPLRWLRGAGLAVTGRVPGLVPWLCAQAMGDRGDLPRIARAGGDSAS